MSMLKKSEKPNRSPIRGNDLSVQITLKAVLAFLSQPEHLATQVKIVA